MIVNLEAEAGHSFFKWREHLCNEHGYQRNDVQGFVSVQLQNALGNGTHSTIAFCKRVLKEASDPTSGEVSAAEDEDANYTPGLIAPPP